MIPKNEAFNKEFPWLEPHLSRFGISLQRSEVSVTVERVDRKLLLEVGTGGFMDYGMQQDFLFLDTQGRCIATTVASVSTSKLKAFLWRLVEAWFPVRKSVTELCEELPAQQLVQVHYVLQVQTFVNHARVTIHKSPKGHSLSEWLGLQRTIEERELVSVVKQIDAV
ncbi:MAG: hypothetical protein EXS51_00550 [Candidatus Taylorbacteria bacterium]|nr:hypothetical protein [Candidatus Taylorbacteria bacterium]